MNGAPEKQTPGGNRASADVADQTPIVAPTADADKRLANLKAAFALQGQSVFELADGGFLVSRRGFTRHCPDLSALAAFARQIGVRTA